MSNKNNREMMHINWEQQKVISNPLRSKIIALLYEKPMTPKELSDVLEKNPGTVYYHIQQLVKHDILEIESERTEKGIVEKLYRSKAIYFVNPDEKTPEELVDAGTSNVYLSSTLVDQLREELLDLFYKYAHLSTEENSEDEQVAYELKYSISKYKEENE